MSFAFFFTGNDSFGAAARRYVEEYYPGHLRFAARSFEDMFAILGREGRRIQKAAGATPMHVDEIIVVSHANAGGGMKIPLTNDNPKRRFTPGDVAQLQEEARRGLHKRFQTIRAGALGGIDRDTRITVRGCELGKDSEEPLDALATLFGGEPRVVAPRAFQGFSIEHIGQVHRLKTFEQAFDWLVTAGYLTPPMAEMTKRQKEAYIKEQFGTSVPTEFFLVGEDDYQKFKAMGLRDKLGEKGESVKTRDHDPTLIFEGKATGNKDALWAAHQRKGRRDRELALPRAELVARAEALLMAYKPSDAAMFLRLWNAWQLPEAADGSVRTQDIDRSNVVEKRPDVFNEENVWRARRDVFDHPDRQRDAFTTEKLAYKKAPAAASDFSRSEGAAGVVDPAAVAPRKRVAKARQLPHNAAVLFLLGFAELTSEKALGRAPLPGDTLTADAELDAALGATRYVVQMLRAGITLTELRDTRVRWRQLDAVIAQVLNWARINEYDAKGILEGTKRVNERFDRAEATLRARESEAKVHIPRPDAGLYAKEAAELGEKLRAHAKLLTQLQEWDARHGVRAGTVPSAAAGLEAQVRQQNAVRTAVAWWAVWNESKTLSERVDAAAKRGLIPATATVAKFVSHGTTAVTESVNVVLNLAERHALAQAALWEAQKMAGSKNVAALWRTDAKKLRLMTQKLTGGAGVVAVISGVLDLISALKAGDAREARAAAHSTAQGAVQVGGAATGAGAGTIAFVSGGLVVIWGTLEAIGIASDNIKGFKKLQQLDVIRRFLEHAAALVPWGKRMAGVADAWEKLEAEDPDRAFALKDDFLARAREPYGIVLKGMLQIGQAMRSAEFSSEVKSKERAALKQLEQYQYRDAGEFGPGDMRAITEVCVVLFGALERAGAAAVRKYGPFLRE